MVRKAATLRGVAQRVLEAFPSERGITRNAGGIAEAFWIYVVMMTPLFEYPVLLQPVCLIRASVDDSSIFMLPYYQILSNGSMTAELQFCNP